MEKIKIELRKTQKSQKIQKTYEIASDITGSILNIKE